MAYVLETGGRIHGNPTLTSLDGEQRAPFNTIIADGWPDRFAESFGVHKVDTAPPPGKQWAGTFDATVTPPVAVFIAIPPPPVPGEVEGWQAEVAMRSTYVTEDDPGTQTVWDRVQDIIGAMPDGIEKITAQTVLSRGKIRRDSPMLESLSAHVPLSSERVDDLMFLAHSIQA